MATLGSLYTWSPPSQAMETPAPAEETVAVAHQKEAESSVPAEVRACPGAVPPVTAGARRKPSSCQKPSWQGKFGSLSFSGH